MLDRLSWVAAKCAYIADRSISRDASESRIRRITIRTENVYLSRSSNHRATLIVFVRWYRKLKIISLVGLDLSLVIRVIARYWNLLPTTRRFDMCLLVKPRARTHTHTYREPESACPYDVNEGSYEGGKRRRLSSYFIRHAIVITARNFYEVARPHENFWISRRLTRRLGYPGRNIGRRRGGRGRGEGGLLEYGL